MRIFDAFGPLVRKALDSLGGTLYAETIATLPASGPPDTGFFKLLRNAGSPDMNVDGSVTPVAFESVVPAGKQTKLKIFRLFILDSAIRNDRFGGLAGGLANGLLIQIIDADGTTVLLDFLDGVPIVINADFSRVTAAGLMISATTGDDLLTVTGDTAQFGTSILLTAGQRLRITVRDDLSSLTKMQSEIGGSIADAETQDP